MADLTVIILTKNESLNIVNCILSIAQIAKRIIVIDSGSTDNTVELAKNLGADVYFNTFSYYAQQFNWAIDNANIDTVWTLRLDADERFTNKLCEEVESLMSKYEKSNEINGFTIEAWLYFLGKKIRFGGSNKRKLMIFRTGIGRIEDRKRDAHTILNIGSAISTKEKFLHYDFKDLSSFIKKYNWYADRELFDYIEYLEGKTVNINTDNTIKKTRIKKYNIYYRFPMFIRALLLFMYTFVFRLGFLDGTKGLIYRFFEDFWYRFLVDAKIYEYQKVGKNIDSLESL